MSASAADKKRSVFRNVKREVKAEQFDELGNKVDSAVRRGIQSGNEGVGKAGKAIEGPVDRTAKRLGLPGGPVSPPTSDR